MNFEAFLHFQEKHRQFLEEEEDRKIIFIRRASQSDTPAILILLAHLWPDSRPSQERIEALVRADFSEGSMKDWAIAVNQDKIIGAISMRKVEPLWSNTPILHIEELVVHPKYLRQKIGSKLIQFAEKFGRENNCSMLELDCGIQRHDSHQFYQNLGFREVSKYFSKNI